MTAQLFQREGVWHCRYELDGVRHRRSTRQTDRDAALLVALRLAGGVSERPEAPVYALACLPGPDGWRERIVEVLEVIDVEPVRSVCVPGSHRPVEYQVLRVRLAGIDEPWRIDSRRLGSPARLTALLAGDEHALCAETGG